ncbi:putative cytochrome p450 alkane protein [Botrytis fragariae]|uniref:Putative cytochrome p450 alkane protein n=1 Tax=Botrytis fragariae TaxID=1964551 RepID=A0A8H6B076_9HELO|nr:putative cytochrome p450 alkane protein [Botrytis fragariae]KAF5876769.1 putative cytochrome p450 alkane protein [Botrytis fragariae]
MASLLIKLLLLFSVIFCYQLYKGWKSRRNTPAECQQAPSLPTIEPFLGLDLFKKSLEIRKQHTILETHAKQHDIYGKTFQALRLGRTTIYTAHPDNLKAIYGTNWKEWGTGRADAMEPFCGRGFVTRDGEEWRVHRSLFASTLTEANTVNLKLLGDAYKHYIQDLPSNGQTVDLAPIFNKLFLDLSLQFLFGKRLAVLYSGDSPVDMHTFEKAFDAAQTWMGIRLAFGKFGRSVSLLSNKWKESCRIVHSFVDHHIVKALEKPDNSTLEEYASTLLENLVLRGKNLDEIRSQILQGMLVTQDTTGIVLSNTIFLLSRSPKIWARLRDDIAALGPVEVWSATDLKNLKLVQNCIKESLRICPLFHANSRIALVDTTLPTGGGSNGTAPIFIPAGRKVSTNFYTLHREKSVFGDDIETFNPDRWNHISPSSWEFMPFSHGPRSCAGRHKALGEASYIVARIASQFQRIESRDDRPWTEDVKLVVKNGNGCQVALFSA